MSEHADVAVLGRLSMTIFGLFLSGCHLRQVLLYLKPVMFILHCSQYLFFNKALLSQFSGVKFDQTIFLFKQTQNVNIYSN